MQGSRPLETDIVRAATDKNRDGVVRCQHADDLAIELSDCSCDLLLPRRVEPVAAKLEFGNGLPCGTVEADRVVRAFLSGNQLGLIEKHRRVELPGISFGPMFSAAFLGRLQTLPGFRVAGFFSSQ